MPTRIEHKVRDGVETKRCGVCEQYKSLSHFHYFRAVAVNATSGSLTVTYES